MADRSLPDFPAHTFPQPETQLRNRVDSQIAELTGRVEHAFAQSAPVEAIDREAYLAAFSVAQHIFEASMSKLAGQPSLLPFAYVMHARDYVRKQADDLLRDIFSPEVN